jgi:small subunit ribosomal protein S5
MAFGQERSTEFVDKLVQVNRVSKVVKGGRRFSFSAIVVVGDEGGRVGWGSGKAQEVPEAVRKATDEAKRTMMRVPMREGRTVHHDVNGSFGASRVVLRPAQPGTGIIAGGPMRAVFEAMGISDVVAKSLGSRNPYNMIRATFEAFKNLETPRGVAAKRGLKVADMRENRMTPDLLAPAPVEVKKPAKPKPAAKKAAPKKKASPKKDDAKEAKKETKPAVKVESKKDALKDEAKVATAKADTKPKAEAKPKAEEKKVEAKTADTKKTETKTEKKEG